MRAGTPPASAGRPGSAAQRLRAALRRLAFGNRLYQLSLRGKVPATLAVVPQEPWPGDAAEGEALLAGRFAFAGELHDFAVAAAGESRAPAGLAAAALDGPGSRAWQAELHSFAWLRDLAAVGGDAPRRLARAALFAWLHRHDRWAPLAWEPGVLGRRIAHWLGQHDFVLASADDDLRSAVFASLVRQARHLARLSGLDPRSPAALPAAKGLVYASLCLPPLEAQQPVAEKLLGRVLAAQILPDGGHISRNPAEHMAFLRDLIDLRALLRQAQREVPAELQNGIDRMTPMLRFFRLGDGGLTLMGGAGGVAAAAVKLTLRQADMRGRALTNASHSGYQRLVAGKTTIVMETGALPPAGRDAGAHAGLLAFELSAGKERLIVNCGAQAAVDDAWRDSQRATAAHSTVVVDDRNAAEVVPGGGLGRRPERLWAERQDSDAGSLVTAGHDGYRPICGVSVQRLLYLAAEGDDVRGEDRLDGPAGHSVAIRFHLHPGVRAALATDRTTALLRLPSGAGWRLRSAGAELSLADSVYLGEPGRIRRSQQVVLSATSEDGTTVLKWALQREST